MSKSMRIKPLAAAVGLAMAAPFMIATAFAAAPGNVPVNGTVVQGSASATLGAGSVVALIGSSATASLTVTLGSTANVINWGNPNTAATLNPNSTLAGFNIGTGSTVNFGVGPAPAGGVGGVGDPTAPSAPTSAVVLNIDNSGQLSTLDGTLNGGTHVNVFVANANGIVVGSTAVLSAPVLGLIASNVDNTALIATSTTPTIALSFATAGSISIANGASLNAGTTDAVLIAGAGTVNVSGTSSGLISTNLVIDGGVSGLYYSSEATTNTAFVARSSVGNVNLTTAATNVNLNLGTAGGVFTLNSVYADGNITNNGSVDLAATPEFTGTLTNNGIINQAGSTVLTIGNSSATIVATNGAISGATAAIYANSTIASNFGSVVNNGTIAAANGFNLGIAGTFTNTSNGQLNVTGSAVASPTDANVGAALVDAGFVNYGLVSVSSFAPTTANAYGNYGDFSNANGSFTNSGTISVNGSFAVNNVSVPVGNFSNSGTITALNNDATTSVSDVINASGTVSNTGTMTFGNGSMSATLLNLGVSDANFNNTGTLSLITSSTGASNFTVDSGVSGTLAGSFSAPTLDTFSFSAGTAGPSGTTPGDIAEINTNTISASNLFSLAGYDVAVDSSVNGGYGFVVVGGDPAPQLGTLTVASGATLAASATNGVLVVLPYANAFANVALAGNIAGNAVYLGTPRYNLNNIQGAGSISASAVYLAADGNVNNPDGGGAPSNEYLKNGLLINAPTGGSTTVTVAADGPIAQYWNLKVLGNAAYQSATSNFSTSGLNNGASNGAGSTTSIDLNSNGSVYLGELIQSFILGSSDGQAPNQLLDESLLTYEDSLTGSVSQQGNGFFSPAPNAGSHLIMQATGTMTIDGDGSYGLGTSGKAGTFYFPGLVMAVSSGDMTVVGNLNNGYGAMVAPGSGIMLNTGGQLAIQGNIYTNGNSLVNYWAPDGVTLNGSLYNVYQPTNTSTGVSSFANTPYLYSSFPGATSTAGGARQIGLYNFVNGY